jgi:hypothetical protein
VAPVDGGDIDAGHGRVAIGLGVDVAAFIAA